jgi:hypothetical protein
MVLRLYSYVGTAYYINLEYRVCPVSQRLKSKEIKKVFKEFFSDLINITMFTATRKHFSRIQGLLENTETFSPKVINNYGYIILRLSMWIIFRMGGTQ